MSKFQKEITALQEQLARLQTQHDDLASRRQQQLLRHALASSWCDAVAFLIKCKASRPGLEHQDELNALATLMVQEMDLLQQLGGSAGSDAAGCASGGDERVEAPPLQDGLAATLAPASDPMCLFRAHVSRPPPPEAATMTPVELAGRLGEKTLEISVQLHVLSSLPPIAQDATLQRLSELWDEYIQALVSGVMAGNAATVEAMNMYDLSELRVDEQGAAQQDRATAGIVPELHLTPQQAETICVGVDLFERLVSPVRKERQELQAAAWDAAASANSQAPSTQASPGSPADSDSSSSPPGAPAATASQHAGDGEGGSGGSAASAATAAAAGASPPREASATSGGGGGDGTGSASSKAIAPAVSLEEWDERAAAAQQHAARIAGCLQKEYVLRLVVVGWFMGALTLEQLSRAAVLSWPFMFRPAWLAARIRDHVVGKQPASGGDGSGAGATGAQGQQVKEQLAQQPAEQK